MEQWYRRFVLRDHLHFVERALRDSETGSDRSTWAAGAGCSCRCWPNVARSANGPGRSRFFAGCRACGLAARRSSRGLRIAYPKRRFAADSCAAVTMFHVLEHLYDPASYLEPRTNCSRPEGRLIVQVPNAACWQFLLLGERWNGYRRPPPPDRFPPVRSRPAAGQAADSRCCATSIFLCATIRRA